MQIVDVTDTVLICSYKMYASHIRAYAPSGAAPTLRNLNLNFKSTHAHVDAINTKHTVMRAVRFYSR